MKNRFTLFSLCTALSMNLIAQQPKESTTEPSIEAPPASPGLSVSTTRPEGQPTPGGKKKAKSGSASARNHTMSSEIKSFSFSRSFHNIARPLIVRSSAADPKTMTQLEEDLSIMSRILEKNAAEYREDHEEAAGIALVTLGGSKGVRAIYLEDYGVVFTLNINIPLRPLPKSEQPEEAAQNVQNEEWNEARSEVFGDRRLFGQREIGARREFDQHQLDEFRNSLVESLRNASNIRNLRDTDWITLVIRGRGTGNDANGAMDILGDIPNRGGGGYSAFGGSGGAVAASLEIQNRFGSGEERPAEPSTMVLRIQKSALDEFTRQKESPEAFRQKVSAILY